MSYSHLNSEGAFKEAIKSCHGVVDLCRIVSELSTKTEIKKTDSSILREFMKRSDWFTHTGTQTENGAIAVAKFFRWWATDNPTAGFWLCSVWYKDRVVAAFVTAMKNGEAKRITSAIRKLLCTGYAPLFDLLNTPEITSRMDCDPTKNLLQFHRPESNTEKTVAEHTASMDVLQSELDDVKSELDQMKRERAAEKQQRAVERQERAAEIQQRAAEKKDHEKTKEVLERALKEMKAMEIHFLKRESGHRRNRDEHDKISVKEEWQ